MKKYIVEIREKCKSLTQEKLILFCNLNCEKMQPGYDAFTKIERWGDSEFISELILKIYEIAISNSKKFNHYLTKKNEQLEKVCPDLDDFTTYSASYGFDVCIAISEMILFILTKDINHVFGNLEKAIDTVDMFIQQKENVSIITFDNLPSIERLIDEHEFMLKEVNRQLTLLNKLEEMDTITGTDLNVLRDLNNSFGEQIEYTILFN